MQQEPQKQKTTVNKVESEDQKKEAPSVKETFEKKLLNIVLELLHKLRISQKTPSEATVTQAESTVEQTAKTSENGLEEQFDNIRKQHGKETNATIKKTEGRNFFFLTGKLKRSDASEENRRNLQQVVQRFEEDQSESTVHQVESTPKSILKKTTKKVRFSNQNNEGRFM